MGEVDANLPVSETRTPSGRLILSTLIPCAAAVLAFALLAVFRGYFSRPYLVFIAGYLVAFAGCAVSAAVLMRRFPKSENADSSENPLIHKLLTAIIILAVVFRVILLFGRPDDDVYRALWEGRVIRAGYSPYSYSPDSKDLVDPADRSRLLSDADPYFERVTHRAFRSFYPPFSFSLIVAAGWVSYTPAALKLLFTLFDICTILLIIMLLKKRRLSPFAVILYAWNPIVLSAFSLGAHHDSTFVFFLVLAVLLHERGNAGAAFFTLGLAAMSNFIAFLALPVFLAGSRRLRPALHFIWPCLPGLLMLLAGGASLAETLSTIGTSPYYHWNDSLHYILSLFGVTAWQAQAAGRILAVLGFISLYVLILKRELQATRAILAILVAFLLFSPTVQPWFLAWFAPLLCLHPARPWILWTGTVAAFYAVWGIAVETGGEPHDLPVIKLIEYLPVFALFVYDFIKARMEAKSP